MALIVQKFGGTSVKNAERLKNVASIIIDEYKKGSKVVAVVSAQGDTTDDLIEKAREINSDPSKREMDQLMTAGEQISAALLAMTIEGMGCPAVSLLGWQAGFETNTAYGSARIKRIDTRRVERELERGGIVVVTGFQGKNRYDDMTTLGRGGSDTSAVALAAALGADRCQIYTDVDGVYTADPRKVPQAKKLSVISYDEMLELASLGAQVLNNRSVEMAKKYNVELEVLSSLERLPGTVVKEVSEVEKLLVSGVTKDCSVAKIAIIGVKDTPGTAFKIFNAIAAKKVVVDVILQSIGRDGTKDIAFTVAASDADAALEAVKTLPDIADKKIECETDIAKVSVVGAGMESHQGIASKVFEALYDENINIRMISTSEIKISVIIDRDRADDAVRAIHDKFEPYE
ncbi:MAG: aspartate kinase [Clostridia bacterium]|nr:aspartate kinase [Clostridia bacterium]